MKLLFSDSFSKFPRKKFIYQQVECNREGLSTAEVLAKQIQEQIDPDNYVKFLFAPKLCELLKPGGEEYVHKKIYFSVMAIDQMEKMIDAIDKQFPEQDTKAKEAMRNNYERVRKNYEEVLQIFNTEFKEVKKHMEALARATTVKKFNEVANKIPAKIRNQMSSIQLSTPRVPKTIALFKNIKSINSGFAIYKDESIGTSSIHGIVTDEMYKSSPRDSEAHSDFYLRFTTDPKTKMNSEYDISVKNQLSAWHYEDLFIPPNTSESSFFDFTVALDKKNPQEQMKSILGKISGLKNIEEYYTVRFRFSGLPQGQTLIEYCQEIGLADHPSVISSKRYHEISKQLTDIYAVCRKVRNETDFHIAALKLPQEQEEILDDAFSKAFEEGKSIYKYLSEFADKKEKERSALLSKNNVLLKDNFLSVLNDS